MKDGEHGRLAMEHGIDTEGERETKRLFGLDPEEMIRQDRARLARQITASALAEFLQLRPGTIRRLGLRPDRCGARGREARYLIDEVAAELQRRNPHLPEIWPRRDGRFLTPPQAAQILAELMCKSPPPSVQCLAKWRHEGQGPLYVRVTRKAIRYRREDLESWAAAGIPE